MSAFAVGLTGGLASGKSTVAGWLTEAGHTVVDADRLVAELYRPGEDGALAVARLFGDKALADDGSVDPQAVAARVFADPDSLRRLEALIHPLVRARFRRLAEATDGVVVLEATKLVEAGFVDDFDLLVTVEAEVEERVARAVARGLSDEAARARLAAQGDEAMRRQAADIVIANNDDLDALRDQVDRLLIAIDRRIEATDRGAADG